MVMDASDQVAARKIVIVTYEGAKLLDVTGPMQAFAEVRAEDGHAAYQVLLASIGGGMVDTDVGIALPTLRLEDAMMRETDTLLVAGGEVTAPAEARAQLRDGLARFLGRPRRLGSICTGALILAELGALDGHEATTHWSACDQLARDHPAVTVRPDAIFVTSGRIWTSAGVSAGIDMALAMIEEDFGHGTALNVARMLVLFLKRPGGQSQFSVELRRQISDVRGRFDRLHDWIRANLDKDLSVPALAKVAVMSPRNFARVYLEETGESPARAVEKLRVDAARRLLEATGEAVQRIAGLTGFGDDERLRRAFVRAHGISPQDYRSRFGRGRDQGA